MDLSIVVPLYNEVENIEELFSRIKSELFKLAITYEIIFVDDGSTDGTREKILEIKQFEPNLRLVSLAKNYGQTEAIAAGFSVANGDLVVTMDGDLQNDPADIIQIIINLKSGYDVVNGWRRVRHDNLILRKIPSMVANAIISYVTGIKIHDLGCSLKGYKREVIKNINLYSEMHRFIPIIAASLGAHYIEIPVTHKPRKFGKSKYGVARIWKVLLDIVKIKILTDFSSRPASFFISASIPFWIISSIMLWQYCSGYFIKQMPSHYTIIYIGTGILYTFLAFSLILFGFLTELFVRKGSYRQNRIVGLITWKPMKH